MGSENANVYEQNAQNFLSLTFWSDATKITILNHIVRVTSDETWFHLWTLKPKNSKKRWIHLFTKQA
jgi:hypothetical protein